MNNEFQTIAIDINNNKINYQMNDENNENNNSKIVYITPYEEEELGKKTELQKLLEPINYTKYYEWIKGPISVIAIFMLLGVLLFLYYKGYIFNAPSNLVPWFVSSLFVIVWCMFHLQDTQFVFPHPMFWKAVQGFGICYMFLVVFLLFQDLGDARLWLKNYDSNLGKPLPEKEYAVDCRLYTPEKDCKWANFKEILLDEFVIYHFVGWWARTVISRDLLFTVINSLVFEFMELTFQHLLPNFHECWWDHIILDVLGCNLLGILLGLYTIKYFKMKPFNWSGIFKMNRNENPIQYKVIGNTSDKKLSQYHSGMIGHWKRFFYVIVLVFFYQLFDLNSFFLKGLLWVKTSNLLNLWRLLILGLNAPLAMRQCYQYVIDKNTKDIGSSSWIIGTTLLLEAILSIKWGYAEYKDIPTPITVKLSWTIFILVFGSFVLIYFGKKELSYRKIEKSKTSSELKLSYNDDQILEKETNEIHEHMK